MNSDYREFLNSPNSEETTPPRALSEKIRATVRQDLCPSPWLVFFKLTLIHAVTAVVTLSFCPQLGFRVFGHGMGMMDFFTSLGGPYFCMSACGFVFLGSSLLVASLILRPEELRVIRNKRLLELGSLAVLSLGFFIAMNPAVFLSFALLWLFGSVLGAMTFAELGWKLRSYSQSFSMRV